MFFEEIKEGDVIRPALTKPITGTEIDLVAQLSGMDLPGFLDAKFAKGWGFKDRVTPGPYLIGCLIGLLAKHGFLADAVWTGATNIFWRTPVCPGDRLSAEVTVTGKKGAKRGGGFITYKWVLKNQNDECVGEGVNT
ncbi:MAG: MaoC family dehydratase [Deltaproteobacteria bacterium]|nr:MaoC family dehydratase [Deltaproteobacteria bacterium]